MARQVSQRESFAAARFQAKLYPLSGNPGDIIKKGTVRFIEGQHRVLVHSVCIPTNGDTQGLFKLAKHNT